MVFFILISGVLALWILISSFYKCFTRFGRESTWRYAFFKIFCVVVCAFLYRRKTLGARFVPATGGCIVIANHTSYADVICLGLACPRPVRYVSWAGFENHLLSRLFMRAMRTIPIAPDKAKDGMKTAVAALKAGEVVCIFPEGSMTRNGSLHPFLGGVRLIARAADVPVVPAYIDGLWGTLSSYFGKKFFKKIPRLSRTPVSIAFGEPFKLGKNAGEKTLHEARLAVLDLGEKLFSARKELREHLAGTLVSACCRHPFRPAVIDCSRERKTTMRSGLLLAISRRLSLRFQKNLRERNIGIVLPPGIAGMVANYACSLCGKIPVNLNFTLGRAQVESCIEKASIETIVTVGAMKSQLEKKFPDFPWTERQIDILDELKTLSKKEILLALAQTVLLPAFLLKKLWRVPAKGGDETASLLFTSGSSGMPKAVKISHKNIRANCLQIVDYSILPEKTRLLCNLPIFHSFGFMTFLWFAPTTPNVLAISTPSPTDFARNLQAIREEKANVMLSTPTFLRAYLRKAPPEYLASMELVIAGAEKTPEGFAEEWEKKFPHTQFLEGYGMTEASPIVAVNKPDAVDEAADIFQRGKKPGSVGILLPGMNAKVCDAESGKILDDDQCGMLFLKGANIISGYVDASGNLVPAGDAEGWYRTGDLVSMDASGFISIRGRQSRFSKIGGEMVPHGSVEEAISKLLCLDGETLQIAVAARPDPAKGEKLVLVTTLPGLDIAALGKRLAESGLPNLWIPRTLKTVPAIPVLGSGKLDIAALARMVKDA